MKDRQIMIIDDEILIVRNHKFRRYPVNDKRIQHLRNVRTSGNSHWKPLRSFPTQHYIEE